MSAFGGETDMESPMSVFPLIRSVIGGKADIESPMSVFPLIMSAFGGKADIIFRAVNVRS